MSRQLSLQHDCTTLGGNSGSVVVDLDSGKALGLHFSGKFLTTNYAVRADIVKRLLNDVRAGRVKPEVKQRRAGPGGHDPDRLAVAGASGRSSSGERDDHNPAHRDGLDLRRSRGARARGADSRVRRRRLGRDRGRGSGRGRLQRPRRLRGKVPRRRSSTVPCRPSCATSDDVLEYANNGTTETVLRYEHYSVVMSKSRRMCFFSAVQHRRRPVEEERARRLEVGSAHSQGRSRS